ncbi:MAG TPA: nuclear transport factor 2 family protein [Solirubrobacteraceae bacterium]|nr:nuclear transport factor 2 family protein [Solirubrobacteraceae bacterium]
MREIVAEVTRLGDNAPLLAIVSEDVINHVDGNSPLGGDHFGREESLNKFPILFEMSGGTMRFETLNMIADDHFAIWLQRVTAERDGRELDHVLTVVWRFQGEKVVEMWDHFADVEEWDRFWHVD